MIPNLLETDIDQGLNQSLPVKTGVKYLCVMIVETTVFRTLASNSLMA
jgi:hypothetical protein